MKLYSLSSKDFNALSKEFNRTAFGKRVALLSNLPIFTLFFWAILFAVTLYMRSACCYSSCLAYSVLSSKTDLLNSLIIVGFILLVSAIFSGMMYYRELRKYAETKEEQKEE